MPFIVFVALENMERARKEKEKKEKEKKEKRRKEKQKKEKEKKEKQNEEKKRKTEKTAPVVCECERDAKSRLEELEQDKLLDSDLKGKPFNLIQMLQNAILNFPSG